MRLDIDNPEAIFYEWRISYTFLNSRTGETFDPTPPKPTPTKLPNSVSILLKRRFVLDVLPDAQRIAGMFSKNAIVSKRFSEQTGGGSLTGWQYDSVSEIWDRAYRNLNDNYGRFDSPALRHLIREARSNLVTRSSVAGMKLSRIKYD